MQKILTKNQETTLDVIFILVFFSFLTLVIGCLFSLYISLWGN